MHYKKYIKKINIKKIIGGNIVVFMIFSFFLSNIPFGTFEFAIQKIKDRNIVDVLWNSKNNDSVVDSFKIKSADAAVIQQYTGGLLVYADDTVGTPKYKTFDDTTGFGAEQSMTSVGASAINWISVAASPIKDEWIVVTRDAGNVIKAQVCTGVDGGVICGATTTITATAGTHGFKNFDVAYEQTSGDALLVYGTATADQLYKIEWTGGAWINNNLIALNATAGTVEWVELTSRNNSNEIGIAYADTADDVAAFRWDGNTAANPSAVILATAATGDARKIDVSFEGVSGDMLVAVASATAGTISTGALSGTTWTIASQAAPDMAQTFIDLTESNPSSDYIVISTHGSTASANTSEGYAWSGAAITDGTAGDDVPQNWVANSQLSATAYLSPTYIGVTVLSNATATDDIDWWTMDSTGTITDQAINVRTRGATRFIDLFDYPNSDKVLLLTSDLNSDLWADTWTGAAVTSTAWVNLTSGGALETSLSIATKDVVDFAFRIALIPAVPTVTSPTVTSITSKTAILGANVTLNGGSTITSRGTCWGTSALPTENCSTVAGTTGIFSGLSSGTMPSNTLIHFRGYAINATGIGYSNDLTFTTTTPGIFNALGKTLDSWGGAIPIEMTLDGLLNTNFPYARARVLTAASETYYFPMTWNSGTSKYEGTIYPGSYYCNGCVDPTTGSFAVTTELDNNVDFSSIDYSLSAGNFTTFIARRRSSLSTTDYTDYTPVWNVDRWNYVFKDLGYYQISGSTKNNVAIGIPFHPVSATITNITVKFANVTINPGNASSTSDAWWWDANMHTLYIQKASMLNSTNDTNLSDVDITFDSDTDLFISRYDHTETADMGERLFHNGLSIANENFTTFVYGGGHEGVGMQAESRAHALGGDDDTSDCMERLSIHVDNVAVADSSGHYTYNVKWNPLQWKNYIVSENNNTVVVVNDADQTPTTGWIQYLNKGISVKRTQTYRSTERFIENLYEIKNNDTVAHSAPFVWEREQWLSSKSTPVNSVRSLLDEGRYYGDTVDVTIETRNSMLNYTDPWLTSYDSGQFLMMGVIFDKTQIDSSTYGIFAGEPFIANTTVEWPIQITVPNSTPASYASAEVHQTGFEHTFSNITPGQTVNLRFAQVMDKETSLANIVTAMGEDYIAFNGAPAATLDQSAYRFFSNINSNNVGYGLSATNIPATLENTSNKFRLRKLLHSTGTLTQSMRNFKLQYSPKVGQCDLTFTGENYQDVSNNTLMSYNNNFTVENGVALALSSGEDPSHGHTIIPQTYVESNTFTNSIQQVLDGQDAMFDFSLEYKGVESAASYCFRIVNEDNSPLSAYTVIPEITTSQYISRGGGSSPSLESGPAADAPKTGATGGGSTILPACSDGKDNDGDGLIDELDPECHLDGNLGSAYLPNKDSEESIQATPGGGGGGGGGGDALTIFINKYKSIFSIYQLNTLQNYLLSLFK